MMIHEKCGNQIRYVTMYTVVTTKSVQEADPKEEGFIEVTDEELSQTIEVYCNLCNQKLNVHETEVTNNLYGAEDANEKAAIMDRWQRWQDETEDLEE